MKEGVREDEDGPMRYALNLNWERYTDDVAWVADSIGLNEKTTWTDRWTAEAADARNMGDHTTIMQKRLIEDKAREIVTHLGERVGYTNLLPTLIHAYLHA